jgi:hypothetical protein
MYRRLVTYRHRQADKLLRKSVTGRVSLESKTTEASTLHSGRQVLVPVPGHAQVQTQNGEEELRSNNKVSRVVQLECSMMREGYGTLYCTQ